MFLACDKRSDSIKQKDKKSLEIEIKKQLQSDFKINLDNKVINSGGSLMNLKIIPRADDKVLKTKMKLNEIETDREKRNVNESKDPTNA